MKRWLPWFLVLAACGSSGSDGSTDAGTDTGAVPATGGGFCCTPSASPACCMAFGGWAASADQCNLVECDGFQLPTQLTKESHGCDLWTGGAGPICGEPTLHDAGNDARDGATDGAWDGTTDAEAGD